MTTKTIKIAKEEPTRFWEKITLVAEISARCSATKNSQKAYCEVLELIRHIIPYDGASLFLANSTSGSMECRANVGDQVEALSILKLKAGNGLAGMTARNKKPVLLKDRSHKSDFDPENEYASVLSVPLLVEKDVIGVLNIGSYTPGFLKDEHVKLMSIVADQFAISIERMKFETTIKNHNEELHRAHQELKVAQDKIIAAEKLEVVGELSVSINHEINNPLAVIVGNVQCMLMQLSDSNQKTQARLKRIESAAMRISEVNRKLLSIDRLVTEQYMTGSNDRMINLDKSASSE